MQLRSLLAAPVRSFSSREWRAAGAALLLGLVTSCSVVVETETEQCQTDADCLAKGSAFSETHCSAERVCVSGGGVSCKVNADCLAKLGDRSICRKSDQTCVSLLSPECTEVTGGDTYKDDNAIVLGSILPEQGPDTSTGQACINAITLATEEIAGNVGGLPAVTQGGALRKLVFVRCNDSSDRPTAVRAAQHLTETVRVPAIIGPAFSGITIQVATDVTIRAGTLIISPSATSAAITNISDQGLVWRTSPSDNLQTTALALLMKDIDARVREHAKLPTTAGSGGMRVAAMNKGDSYGTGLAEGLTTQLAFNGKAALANGNDYITLNYGDPTDTTKPLRYQEAVDTLLQRKPHVIFLLGSTETVTEIFRKVEPAWPAGEPRPFYIFADAGNLPETAAAVNEYAAEAGSDIRKRVLGTVPGTTSLLFQKFAKAYTDKFGTTTSPATFGAAGSYDATFLLAYSIAAQGAGPITGSSLSNGLKLLVPVNNNPTINAGTADMPTGFSQVVGGAPINYNGASGPLDFEVNSGEAPSDIQYWCVPNAGVSEPKSSGAYYSPTSGATVDADLLESFCQ